MWVVYLIQNNVTFEKYIGVTHDLKQRLATHNNLGKKFTTRKTGRWVLIYAEAYRSRDDAYKREARLKRHGSAKVELFKRIERSLFETKTEEGRS